MIITIKECLNCNIKHQWSFDAPHLKELRTIKTYTGLSGEAFGQALADSDPDALTAMLFILHERDRIKIPFDDIDLDLQDFDMQETDEEKAAREEEERLEAEAAKGKDAAARPRQPRPNGRTAKAD